MSISSDIKLIAREAHLQRQINELQSKLAKIEKTGIKGSRSVGYLNPDGSADSKSGLDKGAEAFVDGVSDVLGNLPWDFDILSDETSPGGDGGDSSGGGTSAEDGSPITLSEFLRDVQDLSTIPPGLGSVIKGLEGMEDCATAQEAYVGMDGFFLGEIIEGLPGGSNGETTEDPRDFGFSAGTIWNAAGHQASTPYAAASAYMTSLRAGSFPAAIMLSMGESSGGGGDYVMTIKLDEPSIPGDVNVTGAGCTIGTANCPATNPNASSGYEWASDSIHQLAFDGAQFNTSDQEPTTDQNPNWENSPNSVSGCTSGGTAVTIAEAGGGTSTVTFDNGNSFTLASDGTVIEVNY